MPKLGLFGGGISSREARGSKKRAPAPEEKKKKAPPFSQIVRDARDLVAARRGRLTLGLALLLANRLSGLVLPGTTKFLIDEVIGKGHRELLGRLVLAAGGATLVQRSSRRSRRTRSPRFSGRPRSAPSPSCAGPSSDTSAA
jgi:subfamily B ATP-binding cassette protein MsbA